MNWIEQPLLGFDTETTGVNTSKDRIVTAALVFSTGPGRAAEAVATWLIDPGVEIPAQATEVHGITTSYAKQYGINARDALAELSIRIVQCLREGAPLVAFNGAFDLSILEAELARHHLPTLQQKLGHEIAPVIDPLILDRSLDQYRRGKRTLSDLMQVYEIAEPAGNLHTADVDVSMTLDLLRAMANKFPQLQEMSLAQLHKQQIEMNRNWQENFNQFLQRQGKEPRRISNWPVYTD